MRSNAAPLNPLGDALHKAGWEQPRDRLRRMMREAIEKRGLKGPSQAEFSRHLIESNDASLMWEYFADWRQRAFDALYETTFREVKDAQPSVRPATNSIVTPTNGLSPAGGSSDPLPAGGHEFNEAHAARAAGGDGRSSLANSGKIAVLHVAKKTWNGILGSFLVNGRALGEVTAQEARAFSRSRMRDGRFLMNITEGLPDDARVGDCVSPDEALRLYESATKADNAE